MPNESTAINDLIQMVASKPLRESAEIVFRPPSGTPSQPLIRIAPALPPPPQIASTHRGLGPVVSPRIPATRRSEGARADLPRLPAPIAQRPAPAPMPLRMPPSPFARRASDSHELTVRVPRKLARTYVTAGLFAVGSFMIGIAGYRVLRSSGTSTPAEIPLPPAVEPAPTVAAVPAPAPAPTVAPPVAAVVAPLPAAPPAIAPAPSLVELRLDSDPSGASVMIVDRGKSSPLGSTPLAASVDPARQYDLVFTIPGHPPKVEHVDPRTTHQIAVALVDPAPAPAPAPAKPARHHAKPRSHRTPKAAARR